MKVIRISGIISAPGDMLPNEEAGKKTYSLEDFQKDLADAGDEPVLLDIDTPGGNVDVGVAIYHLATQHGVDTLGREISSIGSVIMLAGKNRKIAKDGKGMIHNAWIDPRYLLDLQLNSAVLGELKAEADKSDAKILGIYTDVLGKDKEQELIALMGEETILGAEKLKDVGFATEIVEAPVKAMKKGYNYSLAAMNLINNNMTTKELEDKIEKLSTSFKALAGKTFAALGVKIKNLNIPLEDGKEIFIATEDGVIVGKVAYEVVDGQPTETLLKAGTYKLKDGSEISVDDTGTIMDEKKAPAPDAPAVETVDTLQAKLTAALEANKALNAEKEAEKTAALAAAALAAEAQTKKDTETVALVNALRAEFDGFKKAVAAPEPDTESGKGHLFQGRREQSKDAKMSPAETAHARIMAKYND